MPRYFFPIVHPGSSPIPDDEGPEFENLEGAKEEAQASIRDLVADAIKHGRKFTEIQIEIRDEAGTLLTVTSAKEMLN
jgi:hypothetical protein